MRGILVILFFVVGLGLQAQDIHFSQFYHSPFNLNPSLAGQFEGDYRFIFNQRTQWRSVTVPYKTFGISADARDFMEIDGLGSSISIYQDKAGDSNLKTLRLNLGASYLMPLSSDSLHTISVGAQLGITHLNIDYNQLNYDNQFDGIVFDPSIDPNENYTRDSRTYLDIHLGASWFYQKNRREKYTAGIGLFNVNTPEQSYYGATIPLNARMNLHASAEIKLNDDWDLMPALLFMSQDKYKEFVLGSSVRHILMNEAGLFRSVFAGLFFRTRDAGYLLAGVDYDEWRVGLSYDINLSGLRPASNGRGGFEIAVIYIFKQFKPRLISKRICPEYL
jgi:type IX secretion system PorP/SprF family membrane protein